VKRQPFSVGQKVLARKKETGSQWARVEITAIRLVAAGGGKYQSGKPSELEFSLRPEDETDRWRTDTTWRASEIVMVDAARDRYRDCWKRSPELTEQYEIQLFCYDFGLDGTDSAVTAGISGEFVSGPNGTDFDHHAKVVFDLSGEMIDSKVSVNLWRLIDFAVDTESLWKYTAAGT